MGFFSVVEKRVDKKKHPMPDGTEGAGML